MVKGGARWRGAAWAAAGCLTLSACNSAGGESGGTLRSLFASGGTAAPAAAAVVEDVPCPAVTIAPGGAALRSYTGGASGSPEALRYQLSIVDVARECIGQADGSVLVKVGVEGRALVGPAGSGGRFDAPLRFVLRRDQTILANRTQRVAVAVPAGESQAPFTAVEEGLVAPKGDFEIEVALGGASPAERPARRARR
jgi:hypothetical protein